MNPLSLIQRLLPAAVVASVCASAFGQGTIVIANNLGATIYPVIIGCEVVKGPNYSVEVFVNWFDPANKIGQTMTLAANGRFSQSGAQTVPGVLPGAVATLVARAWDNTTGATYDTALRKGMTGPFKTAALGGDVDGDPSTPPATAPGMVTGKPDGFSFLYQIPEPGIATLAIAGFGMLTVMMWRQGRQR
jgi:hypothetical protein